MINFSVNNTFDTFDLFATTSLCQHLYDNYTKCNPYSFVPVRKAKGSIFHSLNEHICLLGLSLLESRAHANGNLFYITNFVPENTPFTIYFGISKHGNYYHNISVQTPDSFSISPNYTPADESYYFTYIYTKSLTSSCYDFTLIDINNKITTSTIDPYYNTPNAFLNYCNYLNLEPHRGTSKQNFYTDFKRLLANSDGLYNTSAYPSKSVYCLFDNATNGMFLFAIVPGHRKTHYVILDYRVISYPVPVFKVSSPIPEPYFYDYPKRPF